MTLNEFAKEFCGSRSFETDRFLVELEEMELPFQQRVCLTNLLLLNLNEKDWLNYDVLYIIPVLSYEKHEYSCSYETKIVIHISNIERTKKDGN